MDGPRSALERAGRPRLVFCVIVPSLWRGTFRLYRRYPRSLYPSALDGLFRVVHIVSFRFIRFSIVILFVKPASAARLRFQYPRAAFVPVDAWSLRLMGLAGLSDLRSSVVVIGSSWAVDGS